ncbi:TPA: hypothetical protein LSH72_001218 [Klebsiella oxytoca]|nr:hypothetical protein [Klebsiella oxytoca]HBL6909040.1 hypothetical protein [Klebsiella oxytoca]
MVTRRNVLKIAIPAAAAIPAVALGASSTTGKNVFLSVSDLSTYTGGNGDIGFLVSYHEGKMTGGGTLIHTISSEKPDMINTFSSKNGLWARLQDASGFVDCSHSGMLAEEGFDNSPYHNKLIKYADDKGLTITYGSGIYEHHSDVLKPESYSCPSMIGCGGRHWKKGTILKFLNGSVFKIKGGSGYVCSTVIEGITFSGDKETDGVLTIADQCGISVERCYFDKCKIGALMVNESKGGFTEFDVLTECYFTSTCVTGFAYRRLAGNESFHGTGMKECSFQQQQRDDNAPHIHIGPRCMVYNAPMTVHVFREYTASPIIRHEGFSRSNVYGVITVEKKPKNTVSLVDGSPLYILGSISCLSENLTTNNAILCNRFQANSDGSVNFIRNPASLSGGFNGDREPVIHLNAGESAFMDVTVVSNGVVSRGLIFIAVDTNGKGKITDTGMSPVENKIKHDSYFEFNNSTLFVKSNGDASARWIADISFVASRYQYTLK